MAQYEHTQGRRGYWRRTQRGRDDGAERGVPRGGGGVKKARGKGLEESVTGRAGPL